jgi:hypothetical protein
MPCEKKKNQMKTSLNKVVHIFNHLISEIQDSPFTYTLRHKWQEGKAPYMGTGSGGGGICSTSIVFCTKKKKKKKKKVEEKTEIYQILITTIKSI